MRAGQLAQAESAYTRMSRVGDPSGEARGERSLAWLLMFQGRFHEAIPHLHAAVGRLQSVGNNPDLSIYRNRVILAEAYLTTGERDRARQQLDSAAALGKKLHLDPVFLFYFGHAALRAGRAADAEAALRAMLAVGPPTSESDRNARAALDGALRLLRADAAGALDGVRSDNGPRLVAFRLAVLTDAYGTTHQVDSALATAVRLSNTFAFGEEAQIEWQRGPLLVARYAEAKGDSATARAAYSRFIEQWKNGDRDLPEMIFARRGLARQQAAAKR